MKLCAIRGEFKGENEFTVCGECSGCFPDYAEVIDTSDGSEVERTCAEECTCAECVRVMKSLKIRDER